VQRAGANEHHLVAPSCVRSPPGPGAA
jgi:hypothetical protein